MTVPLRSLGEDELVRVLMGPHNAVGRQYQVSFFFVFTWAISLMTACFVSSG